MTLEAALELHFGMVPKGRVWGLLEDDSTDTDEDQLRSEKHQKTRETSIL